MILTLLAASLAAAAVAPQRPEPRSVVLDTIAHELRRGAFFAGSGATEPGGSREISAAGWPEALRALAAGQTGSDQEKIAWNELAQAIENPIPRLNLYLRLKELAAGDDSIPRDCAEQLLALCARYEAALAEERSTVENAFGRVAPREDVAIGANEIRKVRGSSAEELRRAVAMTDPIKSAPRSGPFFAAPISVGLRSATCCCGLASWLARRPRAGSEDLSSSFCVGNSTICSSESFRQRTLVAKIIPFTRSCARSSAPNATSKAWGSRISPCKDFLIFRRVRAENS